LVQSRQGSEGRSARVCPFSFICTFERRQSSPLKSKVRSREVLRSAFRTQHLFEHRPVVSNNSVRAEIQPAHRFCPRFRSMIRRGYMNDASQSRSHLFSC
jgi:hypothetical protein